MKRVYTSCFKDVAASYLRQHQLELHGQSLQCLFLPPTAEPHVPRAPCNAGGFICSTANDLATKNMVRSTFWILVFVLVQNGVGEQPKVSENDSWKLHASTCCLLCLDTDRFCQSEG